MRKKERTRFNYTACKLNTVERSVRTNTPKGNPVVTKIIYTSRQSKTSTKNSEKCLDHLVPFFYIIMGMKECQYHGL